MGNESDCGITLFHMPCSESFCNSSKIKGKVRTLIIQAVIDQARELEIELKKQDDHIKVIAMIDMKFLWNSEIIVFFHPNECYEDFFTRNDEYQSFQLDTYYYLLKMRNLKLPNDWKEVSYQWQVKEEGKVVYRTFLYFCGDI